LFAALSLISEPATRGLTFPKWTCYHGPMQRSSPVKVPKSIFKPRAFEYFRLVEEKRQEILITDHGRPVARISPVDAADEPELAALRGLLVKYVDPFDPVGAEDWEAAQ
jgi:prevent-host-death family protein